MKTLDEVIKAMEMCTTCPEDDEMCPGCPYADKSGNPQCVGQDKEDALHYLKEYKERKESLRYWSEKAISEQQNLADAYMLYKMENEKDNNSLTWDELKSMEGKPVWVENRFYKKWLIAYKVNDEDIIFDGNGFYTQAFAIDYDKAWQAYRKERG